MRSAELGDPDLGFNLTRQGRGGTCHGDLGESESLERLTTAIITRF